MGVNAIRYTLTKDLKRTLCSKCELFTSKEYSYIPIGQLVSKGGIKAILAYYQTLGQNFVDALEDIRYMAMTVLKKAFKEHSFVPELAR